MCVTTGRARIHGTRAFTYATITEGPQACHVSAYQNFVENESPGPNCMLLHFPGNDIELVRGPEDTVYLMDDVTRDLPELVPVFRSRNLGNSIVTLSHARVEGYGDYTVVLAQHAMDIKEVLDQVPEAHRPAWTAQLDELVRWYHENFPDYSFVLACFNGLVVPRHPIVVRYVPHSDDELFVPGLDGHTGELPVIGQLMQRDFAVAFGSAYHEQPLKVTYRDPIAQGKPFWAPRDVTGFVDNRLEGPNRDYVLALQDIDMALKAGDGLIGAELLDVLIN